MESDRLYHVDQMETDTVSLNLSLSDWCGYCEEILQT